MARWNSTDGASNINNGDEPGFLVPDDANTWDWPMDWNFTRDGSIYLGVAYIEHEALIDPYTDTRIYDYYGNAVGPYNEYYLKVKWAADDSLTQVGDTIFYAGERAMPRPTPPLAILSRPPGQQHAQSSLCRHDLRRPGIYHD